MLGRERRELAGASPLQQQVRRPEPAQLLFIRLHRVADVGGAVRPAARVGDDRQVAALPDCVHGVEEEEPVAAAQQVLGVVLRGRQQHVDAGLVQKLI